MNFTCYAKEAFVENLFYLLRDDGHIFMFNFETFQWYDVSVEVPCDGSWEIFETSQKFDHAMVDEYENISLSYNKYDLHYFDEHPSFVWGKALVYYKKDGQIRAKDENDNEYECTIPYILVSEEKIIDDTWKHFNRLDVLFEVGKFREIVNIAHMKLYLDKNKDLRAFSDDGKEYRVSKLTGNANEVLDTKGVLPSYERVNESVLVKFSDVYRPEYFITWFDLANMRELDKYLLKAKDELLEKYNIKLGNDIWYYNNGFGNIFAIDNYDNEFNVLPDHLVPVKQGTVDRTWWEEVNHLLALEKAEFYQRRKEELKEQNCEILPYDLKLYENDEGEYFGEDDNGNTYFLDLDGAFHKCSLEPTDEDSFASVSTDDVVMEMGQKKAMYFLMSYIKKYLPSFFENQNEEEEFLTLFVKNKTDGCFDLFMKDSFGNEYICKRDSIEKLPKNTITHDYISIPLNQFSVYFQFKLTIEEAEAIEENE